MTTQEAIKTYLDWWRSQIGYHEGPDNFTKYADIPGMTEWLGWYAQNQPWCDLSFDAGMLVCFGLENASKMTYQPIGACSALCRQSAQYYKDNGAWYTTPQPGDQIFFDYGNGINHTGVVEEVKSGIVQTIEGNTSDMVARRIYSLTNVSISGYGRPDWSVVSDMEPGEIPETPQTPVYSYHAYTYNVQTNLLKQGDYGPQVKHMQELLDANGFPCDPDGQFGEKTFKALKDFQSAAGIDIDGEWGGQSFAAMWNY